MSSVSPSSVSPSSVSSPDSVGSVRSERSCVDDPSEVELDYNEVATKKMPPRKPSPPNDELWLYLMGTKTRVKCKTTGETTGLRLLDTDLGRIYPWVCVRADLDHEQVAKLQDIVQFAWESVDQTGLVKEMARCILHNIDVPPKPRPVKRWRRELQPSLNKCHKVWSGSQVTGPVAEATGPVAEATGPVAEATAPGTVAEATGPGPFTTTPSPAGPRPDASSPSKGHRASPCRLSGG